MWMRKIVFSFSIYTAMVFGSYVPAHATDPGDRACLEGYIDKVLAAMIAHNPGQLMLTRDVRYTGNGVALQLDDGIWGTLSARGKYNLYIQMCL
jgi:hypothetical protein